MNAYDMQTSIWGAYGRNEGLLAILSYYLLFLNSKSISKEYIKKIISILFAGGIIQFFYSFLQVFVRSDHLLKFEIYNIEYMPSGTVGNPNMLGSYCVLLLGLSLSLYFIYKNRKYLLLSIIFYINLLLTCSTGPFLSFCLIFVFMCYFFSQKKCLNLKKIIFVFTLFSSIFLIVTNGSEMYFKKVFNDKINDKYSIKSDVIEFVSIFFKNDNDQNSARQENTTEKNKVSENKTEENKIEDFVQKINHGRLKIWKNTFKIATEHLFLGVGIDNLGYVYPQKGTRYCDKAHNEYLQIFATEGIFALLIYLILIFKLFIDSLRSKEQLVWILMISFLVYIVQANFNIRTIDVAPLYFIVIGMMANLLSNKKSI